MPNSREYRFTIEAYTPSTIPMERLAEYMHEFAVLLGETKNVHFVAIEGGCTHLISTVEAEAVPKVNQRVYKAKRGEGPREPLDAIRNINRKLKEDNGTGALLENISRAEIIKFPGREEVESITFGAFNQEGSLDGQVIVVGGKSDPVPVHLTTSEGQVLVCQAARTVAKNLARFIFGPEIRVSGTGRWLRDEMGNWQLERFTITNFDELSDQPLTSVVEKLRAIPGSGWPSLKDPWAELDEIRNGPHGKT